MNTKIILAVSLSFFAAAAYLLSTVAPVTAESMIGYGAIAALLGVAALEYRLSWKRLFGRS